MSELRLESESVNLSCVCYSLALDVKTFRALFVFHWTVGSSCLKMGLVKSVFGKKHQGGRGHREQRQIQEKLLQ